MTSAPDISWSGPAGTFNLRVAAVIIRGGQILLCTVDGGAEPGHEFRWAPVREPGSVDFRPAGLAAMLPDLTSALRHVVLAMP